MVTTWYHQRDAVRRQTQEESDHHIKQISRDLNLSSAKMLLGLPPVQVLEVLLTLLRRFRRPRHGRRRRNGVGWRLRREG